MRLLRSMINECFAISTYLSSGHGCMPRSPVESCANSRGRQPGEMLPQSFYDHHILLSQDEKLTFGRAVSQTRRCRGRRSCRAACNAMLT